MVVKKDVLNENEKKEKTLSYSVKEGAAASVMSGAGEAYIVPFALSLNANNIQIGFLSSFVSLFGSLAQISGSRALYSVKRKTLILASILTQATMWVVILSLGILAYLGYVKMWAAAILILFYTFYAIAGNFGGPSWFSMMGDLVSEKNRGRYFSKRNRIAGVVGMSVMLLAAFLLDYFRNKNILLLGFVTLFLVAAIARFVSAYLMASHYDPKSKIKKDSYFGFWRFVRKAPSNNFGRFVIFIALINLATHFAGPFFAVYMLNELEFSYTWFTLINISGGVFTILTMGFWGKFGDKYGNRALLRIGSIIIPFAPLLWLFTKNPIVIIFTCQLAAGVGWAAFNLSAGNFIYDSVTPGKRGLCVAYFSMFNGVGVFVGAILGGLFAQYVQVSFMNVFLLIFLISGLARGLIALIMLPKIKEVREVPSIDDVRFVKYLAISKPRPFFGGIIGAYNGITDITRRMVKNRKKVNDYSSS